MEINLDYKGILANLQNLSIKRIFLYADFNVINFIYEKKIHLSRNISLYPDSTAIFVAILLSKRLKIKKIISTDIQEKILLKSLEENRKLFFFGDSTEVINYLVKKLIARKSDLNICGIQEGYNYNSIKVIEKINETKPDILFVGLGVGRQEKWIIDNYNKIDAKLIISVGGWFRMLAGVKKRAPYILRRMNLEWLFRLLTEFPYVWKRYLIGVPKFFYRIVSGKIKINLNI